MAAPGRGHWARVSRWLIPVLLLCILVLGTSPHAFAQAISTPILTSGIAPVAAPASISQCANGASPSPSTNGCDSRAMDWVSGNLWTQNSSYLEGDSVPYRLVINAFNTTGTNTVTIQWARHCRPAWV
jgi:hypothetical protein